jgi:hypothetical protein
MYPAALSPAKTDSMDSMDFADLLFWLLGMMNDSNVGYATLRACPSAAGLSNVRTARAA